MWSFSSSSFSLEFCLNISFLSPLWHMAASSVQNLGTSLSHSTERTAKPVPCLMALASCYSGHPLPGEKTARKSLAHALAWHILNPQSMYLLNFNKALLGRDLRVLQEQGLLIVASLTSLLSWCRVSNPVLQHGGTSNSLQKIGGKKSCIFFFSEWHCKLEFSHSKWTNNWE